MSDLSKKKCVACDGNIPAFDKSEIHKYLKKIDGWDVEKDKNQRKRCQISGKVGCFFKYGISTVGPIKGNMVYSQWKQKHDPSPPPKKVQSTSEASSLDVKVCFSPKVCFSLQIFTHLQQLEKLIKLKKILMLLQRHG